MHIKSVFRGVALAALSANICFAPVALAKDDAVQIPVPPPPDGMASDNSGQTIGYLDKAKAAYTIGHYADALSDIEQAQRNIRLKHAESFRAFLPSAPTGWKADENNEANTLNIPAFGGMTVVGRKYSANGNNVGIVFMVDAPPTMIAAMMTPPATTTSDTSAISYADVKGNKALYKEGTNAKTGVPTHTLTLSATHVAVLISSATLGKETLAQFASLIDYDALNKNK